MYSPPCSLPMEGIRHRNAAKVGKFCEQAKEKCIFYPEEFEILFTLAQELPCLRKLFFRLRKKSFPICHVDMAKSSTFAASS